VTELLDDSLAQLLNMNVTHLVSCDTYQANKPIHTHRTSQPTRHPNEQANPEYGHSQWKWSQRLSSADRTSQGKLVRARGGLEVGCVWVSELLDDSWERIGRLK